MILLSTINLQHQLIRLKFGRIFQMKKYYFLIILNKLLILTPCNNVENAKKLQDLELRMDFDKNEYNQDDEISVLVSIQYTGSDQCKTIYLEENSFDTVFIHENGKKIKIEKPFTSMIGRKNITKETPIIFDYSMYSDYDRLFITGLFNRYDNYKLKTLKPQITIRLQGII